MSYIIVWKAGYKEPFIDQNTHGFMEYYSSYEDAKEAAEAIIEAEGKNSQWYFGYKIYEESKS